VNFLKKLFSRKTGPLSANTNVSTAPLTDQQIQAALALAISSEPPQLVCGCGQSNGKQRDHNEDSLMAITLTMGSNNASIPFGLYAIADGMGGHQYGELASGIAIRALTGYILHKFHPFIMNPTQPMDESLQEIMRSAVSEAQRAVMQAAPGSGTTLTAALVLGQQMTIGHVGDSRAYFVFPNGRADVLTRDHSLVKRLEELGQISSDEAAAHPQRNVLYRAVGQGEFLEPDVFTAPFPRPGNLLICSDGLWGVVQAEKFHRFIEDSPNLQVASQKLVAAANRAGGPDNISVILVQLLM
jgi:serine/threonine protein phosphatase PrpC